MAWVNDLTETIGSDSVWMNNGNFLSQDLSGIVQSLFNSVFPAGGDYGEAVDLFPTAEAGEKFDTEFKAALLNVLPTKAMKDEIISGGTSNTHPLKLQLLVCRKNRSFSLHAHPNMELDVPLVGDLWEKRLMGSKLNAALLERDRRIENKEDDFYSPPSQEDIARQKEFLAQKVNAIDDLGPLGKFVDRPAREGSVLYNETGSVHQSYTKDDGCIVLALWSGVHANFQDCACCFGVAGGKDLFLPPENHQ